MKFRISNIENMSFKEIANIFCKSFQGYSVHLNVDENEIKNRFEREGLEKALSFVLMDENYKKVGICFNSHINNTVRCGGFGIYPEYRRKGIAQRFLEKVIKIFSERGFKEYRLEVLKDNLDAICLYKKIGFKVVGEIAVLDGKFFKNPNSEKYELDYNIFEINDSSIGLVKEFRRKVLFDDKIWECKIHNIISSDSNKGIFFYERKTCKRLSGRNLKGYMIFQGEKLTDSNIVIKDFQCYDYCCGIIFKMLGDIFENSKVQFYYIDEESNLFKYFVNSYFDIKYPQLLMKKII